MRSIKFKPPSRNQVAAMAGNDTDMTRKIEKLFRQAGEFITDDLLSSEERVDALIALTGVGSGSENLGSFNGSFIPDDSTIKEALQSLEDTFPERLIFVEQESDFPQAIDGIITLVNNYTYFLTTTVDLNGNRLVCGQNSVIFGTSPENCRLTSTGLDASTALITSEWSLTLIGVTITSGTALDLDASDNSDQALDWSRVNFTDCATIGTIKSYNNFVGLLIGVLDSANMTFDGEFGTVAFANTIFAGIAGETTLTFPSTANITRRIRMTDCAFISFGGATAIDVSVDAIIPNEGYVLRDNNFSGGATYVAGVQNDDNKARWTGNRGISNSSSIGHIVMQGNTTDTVITTADTPVKALGTTVTSAITERFSGSNNRLTYTGALTRNFKVSITCSISTQVADTVGIFVAKNGVVVAETEIDIATGVAARLDNVITMGVVELVTDDYVELWVSNISSTRDVLVESLIMIIEKLS